MKKRKMIAKEKIEPERLKKRSGKKINKITSKSKSKKISVKKK